LTWEKVPRNLSARESPDDAQATGTRLAPGEGVGRDLFLRCKLQAQTPEPRIVNGTLTSAFPTTGALLIYADAGHGEVAALCSGTLIGCDTFLTAAHCVCPDQSDDATSCQAQGLTDPARLEVFFQDAGLFAVAKAVIDPAYSFAERSDLAVLTLARPVTGVTPSTLNTLRMPQAGAAGMIVGFGIIGGNGSNGVGIKREGKVTTAECSDDLAGDQLLCWNYTGAQSNICGGDSGGPLFIDLNGETLLAGVSSGGSSDTCNAPDLPFDTDVFVNNAWIASQIAIAPAACAGLPVEEILSADGTLSSSNREISMSVDVPSNAAQLRVALNGQLWNDFGPSGGQVDFDLEVTSPDGSVSCSDNNLSAIGYCEIFSPAPGAWRVTLTRRQGQGAYQLVASTLPSPHANVCVGDCNGDGGVTVDEVVQAVSIALGIESVSSCSGLDMNSDGQITVDEILSALAMALQGCPAS